MIIGSPVDSKDSLGVPTTPPALECGDLSPLLPLGGLVHPAAPRRAARRTTQTERFTASVRANTFDGDKSPAESGDKSPHSKAGAQFGTNERGWRTGGRAAFEVRAAFCRCRVGLG